ncbi:hypothetical protein A2154_04870 [Candidatus Gottesmanbacteria bacterium RBG_16_43_7]|uniref:Bacterial bifunctional deaminase-reductase C-terminal domain-containing protein n=1 Tax=Candidatus Gottesmanbacteria bacterium RBG_16_43_7 TaxID=1798373 RepID=A0A1F5Z8H7_9BACT|nr:MAG: hypothetical protein A2154_04870 [Candidatus Gottesmanbacteria bacterium RBG_16_43_7]
MDIDLYYVSSLKGKITKGIGTDRSWISTEDQQFFSARRKRYQVIIMGSGTYETIKDLISLKDKPLRIVMTTRPENYQSDKIAFRLEFTAESPNALIDRLRKSGIRNVLIAGGTRVTSAFLRLGLVGKIYLTIEPVLFGRGHDMMNTSLGDIKLQLKSYKKLNSGGTMLLEYSVIKKG